MFIIGNSHIERIVEAAQARELDLVDLNLWAWDGRTLERDETGVRLSAELRERAPQISVSAIGGGDHHVISLNPHPEPFDFVLPSAPHLPLTPGARIVPVDALKAALRSMGEAGFTLLRLLAEAREGALVHLTPPPALRDERPMDSELWRKHVSESTDVSPAYFRLKMGWLHAELLGEICAEHGVTLVPPPPETLDDEGFLKPEFAGVPCHGNLAYGDAVLRQLQSLGVDIGAPLHA